MSRGARRLVATSSALLLLAAPSVHAAPADAGAVGGSAAGADEVVVVLEAGVAEPQAIELLAAHGPVRRLSSTAASVEVAPGEAAAVAAALEGEDQVAAAEPNRQVEVARSAATTDEAATDLAPPPDDPLFAEQWGLENTGQLLLGDGTPSQIGMDVGAREAWAVTRGDPEVVVAVIDSGLDLAHPDLAAAIWQNPDERRDGNDTDGNGTVDDLNGFDAVRGVGIDAQDDQATITELHGTAVAGVIAARADDRVGIAGMAPQVTAMPIRAFDDAGGTNPVGSSDVATLVAAVGYAVDNGADVINASWEANIVSRTLERTLADAAIPVVAAAGNSGLDVDAAGRPVPANYELANLVTVTALDPDAQRPAFANRGATTVDLGAPGVAIVSTEPGGGHRTLADGGGLNGTSFATPFVTGALALGLSAAPDASTSDLIDTLLRTTEPRSALVGDTVTGGSLDTGRFLRELQRPVCGDAALPPAGFGDVEPGSTHAAAVDCIVAARVAGGYPDGSYRPGGIVTRGQLAGFLAGVLRSAGALPEDPADAFTDDDGTTHEASLDALAVLDIVRGDGDGAVRPHTVVTRGQLAAMLVRTHDVIEGERRMPSRSWFPDAADTTHAASIDVARDLGLVRGRTRVSYDATADSRRDQMASTLARMLDSLARTGAIEPAEVFDGSGESESESESQGDADDGGSAG